MIHLLLGANLLFRNYKNKTKIVPNIFNAMNSSIPPILSKNSPIGFNSNSKRVSLIRMAQYKSMQLTVAIENQRIK